MFACQEGHFDIAELLLKHGTDVNMQAEVSEGGNREGGGSGV